MSAPTAAFDCWEARATIPALLPGRIHIWSARLDGLPVGGCLPWLLQVERARAAQIRHQPTREQFIASRAVLRWLLGQYGIAPRTPFACGPHGKPQLSDPALRLRFNLSHSGGLALFAFSTGPEVGVDVEQVRPISGSEAIASRYFAPPEYRTWQSLTAAQRPTGFLEIWTRKEACLKALGTGLAASLACLDALAERVRYGERLLLVRPLLPAPGFVGAVAAEADDCQCDCWQLPPPVSLFC